MRSGVILPPGLTPAIHRTFCELIVSAFKDLTRDMVDFATVAANLWPSYISPITEMKVRDRPFIPWGTPVPLSLCPLGDPSFSNGWDIASVPGDHIEGQGGGWTFEQSNDPNP